MGPCHHQTSPWFYASRVDEAGGGLESGGRSGAPPLAQSPRNRERGDQKEREQRPVAGASIERAVARARKHNIGIADRVEVDPAADSPDRIDHGADSIIGNAYHRQTFLDGASPGAGKMLKRTRATPVPSVIGEVQHPRRTGLFVDDRTRENRLVANRRSERGQSRQCDRTRSGTGAEIHGSSSDLLKRKSLPERDIFAKWNKVSLVVTCNDITFGVYGIHTIPDLRDRTRGRVCPQRAGDDVTLPRSDRGDLLATPVISLKQKGRRRLWPNYRGDRVRSRGVAQIEE